MAGTPPALVSGMTNANNTPTTMRAQDLPEVARAPWFELLTVVGGDEAGEIDLYAHWEIYRQAEYFSDCGAVVMTTSGETWYIDDTVPYQS